MASSQQRKYANQIKPIRQNGHLLLVILLLANMIVNESLPIISDPILGGGVQSVIVSTVLIVVCVLRSKTLLGPCVFHHWVTSSRWNVFCQGGSSSPRPYWTLWSQCYARAIYR